MAYIYFSPENNTVLGLFGSKVQLPPGCLALWYDASADVDDHDYWAEVAANPARHEPPSDYNHDLYNIEWEDGHWKIKRRQEDKVIRQKMRKQINAKRDCICAAGVPLSYNGEIYTLQTRNTEDLLNWTVVAQDAARMAPDELKTIRTAENASLILPAPAVVIAIAGGTARRNAVLEASWQLKDAIAAAATLDEAYDIYEAGINDVWPENTPIDIDIFSNNKEET